MRAEIQEMCNELDLFTEKLERLDDKTILLISKKIKEKNTEVSR